MGAIDNFDLGDDIDRATFEQILDMDEGDNHEFSKSIVFGFFEQAKSTFQSMYKAIEEKNPKELSNLAHFLAGSAQTIGCHRVRDRCKKIKLYPAKLDEQGNIIEIDDTKPLQPVRVTVAEAKDDCHFAEIRLETGYRLLAGKDEDEES